MYIRQFMTISYLLLAVFLLSACASYGDDQNYRELDREDRPERFYTEPATRSDDTGQHIMLAAPEQHTEFILADAGQVETDDEADDDGEDDKQQGDSSDNENPIDETIKQVQDEINQLEQGIQRIENGESNPTPPATTTTTTSEKPNKRQTTSYSEPATVTVPAQTESSDADTPEKPKKRRIISFSEPVTVTIPGQPAQAKPSDSQATTTVTVTPDESETEQPQQSQTTDEELPDEPQAEPEQQQATDEDDAQSLKGLDRNHWPTIQFTPTDGRTVHNPTYVDAVQLGKDSENTLGQNNTNLQLEYALADGQPENYSKDNLLDVISMPIISICELVTAPFKMFSQPPLSETSSPQ